MADLVSALEGELDVLLTRRPLLECPVSGRLMTSGGDVRLLSWHVIELVLAALVAMLSPTTMTWSVLVLVFSKRPLRSGCGSGCPGHGASLNGGYRSVTRTNA